MHMDSWSLGSTFTFAIGRQRRLSMTGQRPNLHIKTKQSELPGPSRQLFSPASPKLDIPAGAEHHGSSTNRANRRTACAAHDKRKCQKLDHGCGGRIGITPASRSCARDGWRLPLRQAITTEPSFSMRKNRPHSLNCSSWTWRRFL